MKQKMNNAINRRFFISEEEMMKRESKVIEFLKLSNEQLIICQDYLLDLHLAMPELLSLDDIPDYCVRMHVLFGDFPIIGELEENLHSLTELHERLN